MKFELKKSYIKKSLSDSSKIIICEVNGGIGNQIFQLASSYCFAKKTGSEIILDTRGCDSADSFHASWHLDLLVKEMQKEFPIKVRRSNNLVKVIKRKFLDYFQKPTIISKTEIVFQYTLDRPLEESGKFIFIPTIEDRFFAEEALRLGFGKFFQRLQFNFEIENDDKTKTLVGLHVRRSDAVTSNRFVPDAWFVKVLKEFLNTDNSFFCFTDSIEKLSFLSELNKVIVFGPEMHPLESIVRLSKCDILVLSRSTFSFWAAAISNSKKIISPASSESFYLPLGKNVSYVTI
jgi:hypothetical protein